jgi:phosphatidylinositol kinase/protein kinase (PI-3  family)
MLPLTSFSDSNLPCFQAAGENTTAQLRERFVPALTHSLVGDYVDRLIASSLGSTWTRLYDSVRIFFCGFREVLKGNSINITPNQSYDS